MGENDWAKTKETVMSTATNKTKVLEQLRKTPLVQVACQRAGIGRATYYRWLKADEAFAEAAFEAIDQGTSLVTDIAESQLINAIKDQNMTAIIFWLKHHHAAYETRVRVDGRIKHQTEELTPEQSDLIERALKNAGLLLAESETIE